MNETVLQAAEHLRQNGFEVLLVKTAVEARDVLAERIGSGKTVGTGGSVTIREAGILPLLVQNGCVIRAHWDPQGEEPEAVMKKAREADVYLTSVNAVTQNGRLVMIDGRGNRVGAICDGPKEVYFVVSENKVVQGGLDAAIARIKKEAAPPNCRRLGLDTPCAKTGHCGGRICDNSTCRLIVAVDAVPRGRKMTVIFTEEKLGY